MRDVLNQVLTGASAPAPANAAAAVTAAATTAAATVANLRPGGPRPPFAGGPGGAPAAAPGGVGGPVDGGFMHPVFGLITPETKSQRELYVGGIPPGMNSNQVQATVGQMLTQAGGALAPGNPVLRCWISGQGQFCFCEFRHPDEATNALTLLDNLPFMGGYIRLGRPKHYVPPVGGIAMAPRMGMLPQAGGVGGIALGGVMGGLSVVAPFPGGGAAAGGGVLPPAPLPIPSAFPPVPLAASNGGAAGAGAGAGAAPVTKKPHPPGVKIVVTNVPKSLTPEALQSVLDSFGTVYECDIVADKDYALVEYIDEDAAKLAISAIPAVPVANTVMAAEMAHKSRTLLGAPSPWVELTNVMIPDELNGADDVEDTITDVRTEAERVGGDVEHVRLGSGGVVYVQFKEIWGAGKCAARMLGRLFWGKTVGARFIPVGDVPEAPAASNTGAGLD